MDLWQPITEDEREFIHPTFQRSARHRGKLPDQVYAIRSSNGAVIMSAMQYIEPGKWERWGVQRMNQRDIADSWSVVLTWLRPLIGDRGLPEGLRDRERRSYPLVLGCAIRPYSERIQFENPTGATLMDLSKEEPAPTPLRP